MGATSAVHWWEGSQMRVLVLGSLVVQILLFIFSFVRRYDIPRFLRSIMWLAYLAGDAVAIYALATLFNRHKDDQDRGGSGILEVVWAPVLLLHLGGHDGITAYNVEDNELWSRHLLTAVSQVTVAIYVFCKSWPGTGGDKRLLQAAGLLFVPGVLKCFAKPWALKSASINSLVSSPGAQRTAKRKEGEIDPLEEYVKQAKAFVREQIRRHEDEARASAEGNDHPPSQQDRQRRRQSIRDAQDGDRPPSQLGVDFIYTFLILTHPKLMKREMILNGEAYKLFVDLSSSYHRRFSILKYFWVLSKEKADKVYGSVREGLASAFLLIYTKVKTAGILTQSDLESEKASDAAKFMCRQSIQVSRIVLPWAAIGLFHNSPVEAYNDIDVKITYAIFCCTALLEVYSFFPIVSGPDLQLLSSKQWPEMVAQYSLIGYFARNKKHSWMMWIVGLCGCKEFLDQRWCMKSCFTAGRTTELVLQYLKAGWKEKIQGAASYRRFNDNRGHWALEGTQHLDWSIKGPFDESVLLWHIATDFCFFLSPFSDHICAFAKIPSIRSDESERDIPPAQGTRSKCGELTACKAVQCRQMSNYMMYLLFVNPEMLLPGTRRNLFITAYDELMDILDKPSLFATACKELKDILEDNNSSLYRRVRAAIKELKDILRNSKRNPLSWSQWKPEPVKEGGFMERVISTMLDKSEKASEVESKGAPKEEPKGVSKDKFIDDAWDLAQGLLALGDDKMWEVIQGVWVEMLCFSASRCRGYQHAKALGSGGEFLSYVWLLLSYMGMETLTERLQRPSHQEGNNSAIPPPSDARNGMAPSTSKIHACAAPSTSNVHGGAGRFPSTSTCEIHIAGEEMV